MKISTKGRYALRMLLDLAEQQGEGFVSLKDIAERQEISKKYLEQIVPTLSKASLLKTNRGFQGGYRLAIAAGKITVGDVLRATEGDLSPVPCDNPNKCKRSLDCPSLPLWSDLHDVITNYLDSITIENLLTQRKELPTNFNI